MIWDTVLYWNQDIKASKWIGNEITATIDNIDKIISKDMGEEDRVFSMEILGW